MNFKLSKKNVLEQASKVIAVGYCGLQHLTSMADGLVKVGHTEGLYGWNCDVYNVNTCKHPDYKGVVITTGYRPFGIPVDNKILAEVEQTAIRVCKDYLDKDMSYNAMQVWLDNLIDKVVGD